ncbi:MarR family transcriptional regulator [Sulfuritalea sp.]|uniref:MarR family winged helix-turn-helix transcriptional regulator n=1 Tax=Sulfuritalea sp. TaxID=2480090 RepID=UPI00286D8702|nr:MarR family transcriptional regulator [Sulfuritalea sp.]
MANKRPRITTDTETRATAEHAFDLRLWLRMLACTNLIESHVRVRLRTEFDITLPRFDLMSQLERSPKGLQMGELSKRMMVTGGNVTGITDQLAAEGLVVREDCPKDRRSYIVKLTPEGSRSFRKMALAHEKWILDLFGAMDETHRDQIYELLGLLKSSASRAAGISGA